MNATDPRPGRSKSSPSQGDCGGANLGEPERCGEGGSKNKGSELAKHPDQRYGPTPNLPSSSWQEQVTPWGHSCGAATTAGRDFPSNPSPDGHPPRFSGGAEILLLTKLFLTLSLFFPIVPYSSACQPSPSTCAPCGGQELLPAGLTRGSEKAPAHFTCTTLEHPRTDC